MPSKIYNDYIHSQKWENLRQDIFARDDSHCVLCGSYRQIQCHHNTYMRLGKERLEDLTTLCASCHRWVTFFLRLRRIIKWMKSKMRLAR